MQPVYTLNPDGSVKKTEQIVTTVDVKFLQIKIDDLNTQMQRLQTERDSIQSIIDTIVNQIPSVNPKAQGAIANI